MSIKVQKPGLATSVQDAGREGHYHQGIPPSGALDQYALRAANLLVGNPATAALLECTLLGPQLEFQRDALVAVCGAHMTPRLDGAEMPLDTASIQVPGGLEPIVLHRDAVSGGGYAMIGTVISPDLNLIAQMQPNQRARFVAISLEEGLAARRQYNQQLERLKRFFLA
jgi:allophanate hydrolase subunit 2